MKALGLHPTQYHAADCGNAHPLKKGESATMYKKVADIHFKKCMINGPTRNLNPKARAKVLAARKAAGL